MAGIESAPSLSLRTARIVAPVGAIVLTLAVLLLGGAWWAPLEVNRLALEEEQRQVANNLRHRIDGLGLDLRGTSLWDDAVKNVRIAYNEEWVLNNYGSWLSQQYKHDETFVLGERDGPIFASEKGERLANAAYGRRAAAFGPLVRELRQAERTEGGAFARARTAGVKTDVYGDRPDVHLVLRFALVDGRPAMLGAMAIVPDLFTVQPPPGPAAVVLSLKFMDGDVLTRVGNDLLLTGVGYAPPGRDGVAPDTPAALSLAGDPALGWVTWTPKRPGNLLRAYVLPGALAVAVAAIVSTVVAGRHARRMMGDLLASEAKARHLAHHDPVTGQPNRRLFSERLDKALAAGVPLAVFYLDLDRFKEINDSFGHGAGDELIGHAARRLRGAVRDGDLVARLGGDEFAVLVPRLRETAEAVALGERLLAIFDQPFSIVSTQVRVSISIGVALAPDDGDQRDELMRRADIALYRAKAQGRGICRFFSAEMDESLQLRRAIETDLRAALAAEQVDLVYQPLYERDGATVRGVEALARWTHPERGPIPPNFFVSVAEESDLIHVLGEQVLRRACLDAMRWPSLTVAVNLSPRQVRSVTFPQLVARVLTETGLDPDRLELEVTEGVLMDESEEARNVLARLRATGVRIALDDFGTGYSSLSYLRRFDFDRVKIDRSFVGALAGAPEAAAIIRAVVDLGRALGMEVTAEGVETEEQHRFLLEIGCDRLQGFLFSRPVPAAQISRLLAPARPALVEA